MNDKDRSIIKVCVIVVSIIALASIIVAVILKM
jgi:hypothetical protein